MNISVKKVDNSKVELNIGVSGEVVKNKFEDIFKKIGENAKVSGFRQGHVPRDILEKNFSAAAHEQVLKELIPEIYDQAVAKEVLDVVDLPEISEVKLDRNNLSFKATVEIKPQIQLKEYKGVKINYKKIEVNSDELKRQLDSLKESRKIDNLDDNFARGLGYPSLAELEKTLEKQIFIQKENQQRQRIENEILDKITASLDFKVPESLVKRQTDDLLKQTKVDLMMRGFPREKIDAEEKEMLQKLEPEAKKQVKLYLVLAEIAKKENISLDEHMPRKVIELLFREADWKESV